VTRRLVGLGSAAAYALLLALALDFRWDRIVNLPQAGLVAAGTGLLWLVDWSRGRPAGRDRLRWRLMVTGFLVTVAGQAGLLAGPAPDEPLARALVVGCLPLFYSLFATLAAEALFPGRAPPEDFGAPAEPPSPGGPDLGALGLTRQELRVAQELRSDDGNKAISGRLFISENTLKKHIRSVYRKAGVSTRMEYLRRWGN